MMYEDRLEAVNYANDSRVRALDDPRHKYVVDEDKMTVTVRWDDWEADPDGNECIEHEATFPAHAVVCNVCDGKGSHVAPGIDSNGLTADDFYDDPDFAEGYHRGAYNQTCNLCKGKRVTFEPDHDAIMCGEPVRKELYLSWCKDAEQAAQDAAYAHAEHMAEVRAGC